MTEEISALGAAIMAVSAVTDESVGSVSRRMARVGDVVEPDPDLVGEYATISAVQGDLYTALSVIFPRLEQLRH